MIAHVSCACPHKERRPLFILSGQFGIRARFFISRGVVKWFYKRYDFPLKFTKFLFAYGRRGKKADEFPHKWNKYVVERKRIFNCFLSIEWKSSGLFLSCPNSLQFARALFILLYLFIIINIISHGVVNWGIM